MSIDLESVPRSGGPTGRRGRRADRSTGRRVGRVEKDHTLEKVPPLLGSKEVAEQIGADPKNMHHVRKNKMFPEPDVMVGTRPFWFKPSIDEYQERMEEWRNKDKPD